MINTENFGMALQRLGYTLFSGVPCSFLKYLINYAINTGRFIEAANEGDAVAICAGATMGGRGAVVLMQNSGLTNAMSPLTSLNHTFRIPVLGFVSLRGEPGIGDEPQHELTGVKTTAMLDAAGVKYAFLDSDTDTAISQLNDAQKIIRENQAFFFIVRKNTFAEENLNKSSQPVARNKAAVGDAPSAPLISRFEALKAIASCRDDDTLFLACTGKTGRELFEISDTPHNFYMIGSMGCVGSIGLGLCLARTDKRVVAVDGDGAVLMRMGALATNGYYAGENLLHIVLDNGTYDSTGGQSTVSEIVDFPAIAGACGYGRVSRAGTAEAIVEQIMRWKQEPALTFLYVPVKKGSKKPLGRPTVTPVEIKQRFMAFVAGTPGGSDKDADKGHHE